MGKQRLGAASAQIFARPDTTPAPAPQPTASTGGGIVAALQRDDQRGTSVLELRLDQVVAHPDNPRSSLRELDQLAGSIKELGVLSPVLVVPVQAFMNEHPQHAEAVAGHDYVLAAGHRRHAAARLAGLAHVPALVKPTADKITTYVTFIDENLHRAGLDPIEEARAYALLADAGLTQAQIATRLRVSQAQVSKRLALLRLPQPVQDALTNGTLSVADALALSGVASADQLAVWELAQQEGGLLSSAVTTFERRRTENAAAQEAVDQAQQEGTPLVDDPQQEWGSEAWKRRLHTKADIAAARKTGDLRAVATKNGVDHYSAGALSEPAHVDQERSEKRDRDHARKNRTDAARRLVQDAPSDSDANSVILSCFLTGGVPYADTLKLVHKWLGDRYATPIKDPYDWARGLVEGPKSAQLHVAWAFTIARQELVARWAHGPWSEETKIYLDRLIKDAGYEPTPWETQRLSSPQEDAR